MIIFIFLTMVTHSPLHTNYILIMVALQ